MLLFTNLETVFAFFFLAASFQYTYAPLNVVLFLIAMACIILLQQKVVDLTRSINPEKKGSVYDLKFQKIWFTSCDEAERAQIGQASFQAYRTTTVTCMIVYLVLTLMNFMAGTGASAGIGCPCDFRGASGKLPSGLHPGVPARSALKYI